MRALSRLMAALVAVATFATPAVAACPAGQQERILLVFPKQIKTVPTVDRHDAVANFRQTYCLTWQTTVRQPPVVLSAASSVADQTAASLLQELASRNIPAACVLQAGETETEYHSDRPLFVVLGAVDYVIRFNTRPNPTVGWEPVDYGEYTITSGKADLAMVQDPWSRKTTWPVSTSQVVRQTICQ